MASSLTTVNAGNRLDRLPVSHVHKAVLLALAFAYFFELGDLNTFAYTAPALITAWGLQVSTIGLITSASFLGMFIGATLGGWIADRIGRRTSLLWMVAWFSVFSLLNAVAWDPVSLGIFRFLTGMGLSAMTIVANTYISEFFPPTVRGRYQGWAMTFGLLGIPATAWVARFIIPLTTWSWRLVFVWGALGVVFLIFALRMQESPRWLEKHGLNDRADAALQRLEDEVTREKGALPKPDAQTGEVVVSRVPLGELFSGTYLSRTVILLVAWIFQTLGFYGFVSWVPTLLVAHGFSLVSSLTYSSIIALGAPIGALVATQISERLDRKWLIVIVALTTVVFGLSYGLTFQPALIVIAGFLVTVSIQCFAPLLYAYTPELYPTEARALGTGLTYGVGRLANIVGPLIVSALYASAGYSSVFVYVAATWVVVAVVVGIWGPLTHFKPLQKLSQTQLRA
ncbi:MAG: MFS transporter [Thermaerobacter sp.]|nr:MFS transporter [Thermaerobacter sp.]